MDAASRPVPVTMTTVASPALILTPAAKLASIGD